MTSLARGQQHFQGQPLFHQQQQQYRGQTLNSPQQQQQPLPYIDPCQTKTRTSEHQTQCDAYYECFNGQPTIEFCPNGLVYHGKSNRGLFGVCDYDFNVDCGARTQRGSVQGQSAGGQPDPCTLKARVVGDETYCDRYWECINGQPQLFDCPNGLVFVGRNRGIAEGCDYPWRGNYCFNKQAANAPISTEHCEWLYGIFGHETSCTRYWTCWNGTATEQFCIGGLLYNEETHACDWPQNVVGCQKHPLCKEDPNANVQLGKSCERYWACQGGYPRLQRCPATLVFDRVSRRCVAPPTADCDVPATTPRPESHARQGIQGQNVRASQVQEVQAEGGRPVQGQQPVQIRRPQPVRRPVPQRAQFQPQEQELPPQEQFVGEEQANFEPAQQDQEVAPLPPQDEQPPPARPLRPARPQFSPGPQLPFIPSGATPIQFNSGAGPRLPPIPGAIPVRLN